MKRIIISAALFLALGIISAGTAVFNSITLSLFWAEQPSPSGLTTFDPNTNWCFVLSATTNLGTPQSNWPPLVCLTNWTLGSTFTDPSGAQLQWYTSAPITLSGAQWFFSMDVSNWNGQFGPSNPAWNPAWQTPASRMGILKR